MLSLRLGEILLARVSARRLGVVRGSSGGVRYEGTEARVGKRRRLGDLTAWAERGVMAWGSTAGT